MRREKCQKKIKFFQFDSFSCFVNPCLPPGNTNSLTQICGCGNNFAYRKNYVLCFWQSTAKVYFENTRRICITYIHVEVYSRGSDMVFCNWGLWLRICIRCWNCKRRFNDAGNRNFLVWFDSIDCPIIRWIFNQRLARIIKALIHPINSDRRYQSPMAQSVIMISNCRKHWIFHGSSEGCIVWLVRCSANRNC